MGKKRNKKAIAITAIVMFIGVLLVLTGFFGGWFLGLFYKDLDCKNIAPEDLGKSVKTDILVYYENIEMEGKALQYIGSLRTGDGNEILLVFTGLSEDDKNLYYSKALQHVAITGRLRAMTDAEYNEICEKLYAEYDHIYEEKKNAGEWEKVTLEQFHQRLTELIVPYSIDVTSVSAFNWIPFIPFGIVIFFVSLLFEICFVFKLKKRVVIPVVFAILILIPVVLFFNHIRTMLSVKKVSSGLYTMKNYVCTDTDGMLASDSESAGELFSWIFDKHLYGIDLGLDAEDFEFGCAAFAAVTPEGDHIFGRNFDYPETDTLLVYSHPKGAYESIGVADLGLFRVGQNSQFSPDSAMGKFIMVFTPYFVVDGMNEKGVGVGILELAIDEPHQDNGKPDLLLYCAIRGILDKCASVDEALALLESYDIHSDIGNFHLFITDRSGRYVVVEWLENGMTVTEYPCCTNTVIAPGKFYGKGDNDERLGIIENDLKKGNVMTEQQAMELLGKAKGKGWASTEWSCVYNLDDFTVSICLDADYTKVYTFNVKDLK